MMYLFVFCIHIYLYFFPFILITVFIINFLFFLNRAAVRQLTAHLVNFFPNQLITRVMRAAQFKASPPFIFLLPLLLLLQLVRRKEFLVSSPSSSRWTLRTPHYISRLSSFPPFLYPLHSFNKYSCVAGAILKHICGVFFRSSCLAFE